MLSLTMNEAVRRGAWTCFACSTVPRSTQALITTAATKRTGSKHQRNHSSSKASSSSKGGEARPLTTASDAPTKEAPTVPTAAEKRSSGRRTSKIAPKQAPAKVRRDTYPNIPSVPSTQNVHPWNVHIASLFSQNRPISLTHPFPTPSTESQFSSIFESKAARKTPFQDVIYTLSFAIESLDNAAAQHEQHHTGTKRSPSITEMTHLDGESQYPTIDMNELSKHFRPFVPPPPPVPFDESSTALLPPTTPKRRKAVKQRTFSTTLIITEQAHPNGHKIYQARISPIRETHSPLSTRQEEQLPSTIPQTYEDQQDDLVEIIDITPPSGRQPFRERMRNRHQAWEDGLEGKKRQIWRAISVKRQRKLKMKKHKYKKLMRRTRNLRRRMDKN
ncbi:MAG: hypothetical protein Q9182_003999 [Xanthomendoza sp. 2 TL-2023]